MTAEAFQIELETKLAEMSESELFDALVEAGCVFQEPWLDSDLDSAIWISLDDMPTPQASDYNELALAA